MGRIGGRRDLVMTIGLVLVVAVVAAVLALRRDDRVVGGAVGRGNAARGRHGGGDVHRGLRRAQGPLHRCPARLRSRNHALAGHPGDARPGALGACRANRRHVTDRRCERAHRARAGLDRARLRGRRTAPRRAARAPDRLPALRRPPGPARPRDRGAHQDRPQTGRDRRRGALAHRLQGSHLRALRPRTASASTSSTPTHGSRARRTTTTAPRTTSCRSSPRPCC